MSKPVRTIRILPDNLVNIIAAGEVVERPASVIKELVENALDAGASRITVRLKEAGKGLVQVADDGSGMSRDDALMALERHATSKISSPSDLSTLVTLGFRGEALPSIAAVGRFVLETWDESDGEGTRITVDYGRLVDVTGCGRARGTSVSLAGIFSRLPARRKFLRSRATEMSWCLSAVEDASLTRTDVHFEVLEGRESRLQLPPVDDLRKRIAALWGQEAAAGLAEISASRDGVTVSGFISPPAMTYPRRLRHKVIVNGRPVRDPGLNRIISGALADMYPGSRFPALVLSLEVPPELVDVNVHPAKREVRIRGRQAVAEAIRSAAGAAGSGPVPRRYRDREGGLAIEPARESPLPLSYRDPPGPDETVETGRGEEPAGPRRILGQFQAAYILYEEDGALHLVDQHAAHERILYNRLLDQAGQEDQASQRLTVPQILEPGAAGVAGLRARTDQLRQLGFEIEEFGAGSLRVTAVPAALSSDAAADMLQRLALDLEGTEPVPQEVAYAVSRAACRTSVRSGRRLSHEEMERLVVDLGEAEAGLSCPHGRPTRVSLTPDQLEKMFGRR